MSINKYQDSKYASDTNNPCMKERKLSLKCLDDNNYDYELCQLHFDNYNNCQKFWKKVATERIRKGIAPAVPEGEEREKIKQEYLKK